MVLNFTPWAVLQMDQSCSFEFERAGEDHTWSAATAATETRSMSARETRIESSTHKEFGRRCWQWRISVNAPTRSFASEFGWSEQGAHPSCSATELAWPFTSCPLHRWRVDSPSNPGSLANVGMRLRRSPSS